MLECMPIAIEDPVEILYPLAYVSPPDARLPRGPLAMQPLTVTRSVRLQSAPEEIWPLLVETDRLNRLIGLAPVTYHPVSPEAAAAGARLVGETRLSGFRVLYEEWPYEWSWPRRFAVLRRYRSGPMSSLVVAWELRPDKGGTTLTVTMRCEMRLGLLRPIAAYNLGRSAEALASTGEKIDACVRQHGPNPYQDPVSPSNAPAVARGVASLVERGVDRDLAARVGQHLRAAPDADCLRLRPYALADAWGMDRRRVLVAFLHAVSAGLVELRWSILCPSCLSQSEAVPTLSSLSPEGHCDLCDIRFEIALDQAVEATFFPNPAVRQVPDAMFCLAGPARTPHVLAQANAAPGEVATLTVPEVPGRYRLFARGGARAAVLVGAEGPAEVEAGFDDRSLWPAEIAARPGGALRVRNAGEEVRHVKLERLAFVEAAATAHEVSTLPEFRALFSRELLKPSTPLKVARAALLFTDLTGSTALYSALGDAAAFRFVDDHFDALRAAVAETGGVLVKTMGDAVMAAWPDERAAMRGALACQARFEAFRRASPHGERVGLKLGLHAGPSYVVTANGTLDYFGQTVNVASRLQHLAEGGELVVEARAWEALDPAERAGLVVSEPFTVLVRGVPEPMRLLRIVPVEADEPSDERQAG